MTRSASPVGALTRLGARSLPALLAASAVLCCKAPAQASARSGLIVVPRPASQLGLSYFKLSARPGGSVRAGAVELRNLGSAPLRVALTAVDGQTLSTLGSGYAPPGSGRRRSTRWLHIGSASIALAPGRGASVPVTVRVPRRAASGDYLAGVSVESLDQDASSSRRKGISIASVDRYVIGVEVSVPGPRRPLIRFTGAEIQREPAGLTFMLLARNPGNVILQGTHGGALITQGRRTVASVALGPGTFVTGTSIAYPIPVPSERPREGAVFRVRANLRYAGGIARLDTDVRFGRAAALAQQAYGGPKAPASSPSRSPMALVALLGAAVLLLVGAIAFLLLRRRREGRRSAVRALDAGLAAARESGEPLSLITLELSASGTPARRATAVVRSRVRPADRLCRLQDGRFLIVAADTDPETADAIAADLRRHLERAGGETLGVAVSVQHADAELSATELLQRVGETNGEGHALVPSS